MSYLWTVFTAIRLCFVVLIVRSVIVLVMHDVVEGNGFGFGVTFGGVVEAVRLSVVLGWLGGSAWYLIRRSLARRNSAAQRS